MLDFPLYGSGGVVSADINVSASGGTADSDSFKNDILAIYNTHGQVLDTLRLETAGAFSVECTATGVSIYAAGDVSHPGRINASYAPLSRPQGAGIETPDHRDRQHAGTLAWDSPFPGL